ncbi:MAG: FkbM family methyltransferase [Phycisphaerales bacterium]|nr:FkbM family methyltransferase [Phycisphaerales bacterium]
MKHKASRSAIEVWYAIPSANPENCRARLPVWREKGYRVAVLQNWKRGEIPADLVVWSDTYPGWPGSVNILCREIVPKTATIVVSGGDDMLPDPNFTAQELAEQFLERFPDTFGVMQPTGDGFMSCDGYCGSPWLGRAWFERAYGGKGPMWGEYHHNWADKELHWVAKGLGALWQRPDLTHRHEHFTRGGDDRPDYWAATVAPKDQHDVELFLSRKWAQFPGHEPLGEARKYNHALAARGDDRTAEQHWSNLYGPQCAPGSWLQRMRAALESCAVRGMRRVALYGAGTHTRTCAPALAEPPVEIAAIIDDNAKSHGKRLFGFPIVSLEQACALRLDAVILSANSHEETLWERSEPLRRVGVEVIRLYKPTGEVDPAMVRSGEVSPAVVRQATPLLEQDAYVMMTRVIDASKPAVILDIGANVGATVERLRSQFRKPTIYAFEPAPDVFERLCERAAEWPEVRPIRAAVGASNGEVEFRLTANRLMSSVLPASAMGASFHGDGIREETRVRAPMVTIDAWAESNGIARVDAVKLDVQGLELAALRGARRTLTERGVMAVNCEAQLAPEYEGADTFSEIDLFLRECGFGLYQVHEIWSHGPEQRTTCVDALWVRREALDWLRVQPERAWEVGERSKKASSGRAPELCTEAA